MLKYRNPLNEHAQHFAPFILSLSISFSLFLFCASMFQIWFGVTPKGCRSGQTTFVGMAYNPKVLGSIFLDNVRFVIGVSSPHAKRTERTGEISPIHRYVHSSITKTIK